MKKLESLCSMFRKSRILVCFVHFPEQITKNRVHLYVISIQIIENEMN